MKTIARFFFLLFLFLTTFNINSICQIKVFDNNYVGINFSTTPAARFVINGAGNSGCQAYIYNPNISTGGTALYTYTEMGSGGSKQISGHQSCSALGSGNFNYGLLATAFSATALSVGRAYGVYAMAGNATSGYNYSVYGYLSGTNKGAAIFGAINGLGDVGLSQQYAGYFRGDVKVEYILWASDIRPSDIKFKTNIINLESIEALEKILKINPIKYNLKQIEIKGAIGDTIKASKYYDETTQIFTKPKYGIIAQELQTIYPDLVYKDGEGNLGVDYTGLIPIMIKALQGQQKKIDELEVKISDLTKKVTNPVKQ